MLLPSKDRKLIFLVGVIMLWISQAAAAEKDYQALSLEDCLALAREQNPVLTASREKVQGDQ